MSVMRKYLKPALEIEAFDVEDVITASVPGGGTGPNNEGQQGIENPTYGVAAPIDLIELN